MEPISYIIHHFFDVEQIPDWLTPAIPKKPFADLVLGAIINLFIAAIFFLTTLIICLCFYMANVIFCGIISTVHKVFSKPPVNIIKIVKKRHIKFNKPRHFLRKKFHHH